MKWVKLDNNIVFNVLDHNPNGLYHIEFLKECVQAPDNVQENWIYNPNDGTFSKPDYRSAFLERKMKQIVKNRATKLEEGILYNGKRFDSDQKSRDNITGVLQAINLGWKLPSNFVWMSYDNEKVSFTEEDIKQLALMITQFVNDVYNKSFQLKDQLQLLYDLNCTEQQLLDFKIEL